ncbi:MAG: hypothetical protein IJL71_01585 [Oscillospiraceae bacterium]|nr:hypothetical protein [Oscillospiraceae bacterium]
MRDKRSDKKISTWKLLVTLVVFILVAGFIVLAAVNINDLSLESMGRTLKSWFGTKERAETISYEGTEPVGFAELNGGLITLSLEGFTVFDEYGNKAADRSVVMSEPVAVSGKKAAGVFDRGGKTLFIINPGGDIKVYESDEKLLSVSVNANGWFALCTEETNYKGSVTVLNSQRKAVYKFYSGDGYLLNAVVSDDNKSLAAVKLNSGGSELVRYSLNSEEVRMTAKADSQVMVKAKFGVYNGVSVLTDTSFIAYDDDGQVKESFGFSDYRLGAFSLDGDGFSVILCRSDSGENRSKLVTLDDSGKVISELEIVKEVKGLSASGRYIAVLYSDGLSVYDKSLKERRTYETDPGAESVMMCGDGAVIVAGEYSAAIVD